MTTFDLWLQTQPDDAPEPTARNLADARDQLSDLGGEMPSDEEVYALAYRVGSSARAALAKVHP